eukprot:CAMPEP_0203799540 /NCGR_PEP_ID=MMETSP0100_2-20121128/9968_1 /ASSEMBLY_ACC=CAM_ASM_000210 /TAXON_ID=96639 /ORGANISM=" , Strain NY0313808BC1" /LENGTH=65 /DNA_ID=CAMNT_0050705423 /DNA_START=230 /DNA_END=427 /DNA_ORIENTATION=-
MASQLRYLDLGPVSVAAFVEGVAVEFVVASAYGVVVAVGVAADNFDVKGKAVGDALGANEQGTLV